MFWDQDRTEQCVKLWNEGYSATEVANRIGRVSRNAVIGKIHRLGLAHRLTTVARKNRGNRTPKSGKSRSSFDAMLFVRKIPKVHESPLPPEPIRPDKLMAFADLTDKTCRFIYGDPKRPDSGFCPCEKAPGASYCAGHLAKCTEPRVPRKRYVPKGNALAKYRRPPSASVGRFTPSRFPAREFAE